jgi:hypothetical protein
MDRYKTTDEGRAELARLGLSDESLSALRQSCLNEKLSDETWKKVLQITRGLAYFDKNSAQKIKTPKQRLASFRDIEMAAIALRKALENLVDSDLMEFDRQLYGYVGSRSEDLFEPGRVAVIHRFTRVTVVAGRKAQRELRVKGLTNLGRKGILRYHAAFIADLSDVLTPQGINTTNAGPFRRICDAVFAVAVGRSTAEGAIAYFLKDRKGHLESAQKYREEFNEVTGEGDEPELTDEEMREVELRHQNKIKSRSIYLI